MVAATVRSRRRRPGEMSAKKSLSQRYGAKRVARWPRRQSRQVRQRTCAPWAVGRFSTSIRRSARGLRFTGVKGGGHYVSKPPPPNWRGVGEEEPRPTAWKVRVALWSRRKPRQVRQQARAPWAVGWFSTRRSDARVAQHASRTTVTMRFRSRRRRPGAVSVRKSLGQRRGVERAPRWPRRQPRQVRQRARAPWAVGRFSTGRSAAGRAPSESKHGDHEFRSRSRRPGAVLLKKSLGQRRGVERAPRWPRRYHAKSASARVLRGRSAGSPRGEARAGRAPRESKAVANRFEAAAADLARCR